MDKFTYWLSDRLKKSYQRNVNSSIILQRFCVVCGIDTNVAYYESNDAHLLALNAAETISVPSYITGKKINSRKLAMFGHAACITARLSHAHAWRASGRPNSAKLPT